MGEDQSQVDRAVERSSGMLRMNPGGGRWETLDEGQVCDLEPLFLVSAECTNRIEEGVLVRSASRHVGELTRWVMLSNELYQRGPLCCAEYNGYSHSSSDSSSEFVIVEWEKLQCCSRKHRL